DFLAAVFMDIADVLANRVGGALEPIGPLISLLRGQDFDEAAAEGIEFVAIGDVPVQADAQKLRQDINAINAAVDAIADRDIDEAVLAGQGHRRLAAELGQRIEPRATAAAQN